MQWQLVNHASENFSIYGDVSVMTNQHQPKPHFSLFENPFDNFAFGVMRDNLEIFLYLVQSSIDLEDKINTGSWSYATLIGTNFVGRCLGPTPSFIDGNWSRRGKVTCQCSSLIATPGWNSEHFLFTIIIFNFF